MSKQKYLLVIIIMLLLLLIISFVKSYNKSSLSIDTPIPDKKEFQNSTKSNNFYYNAKLILNGIKKYETNISLQYNISIEPKNNKTYRKVIATAFINEEIQDILTVKTRKSFSVDVNEDIIIDNSGNNNGLELGLVTWLDKGLNKEDLINKVRKPIKLHVSWKGGEEYIYIPKEKIEVIYID